MRFWRHGCKIEEICYNIDMERRIGRLVLERGRWNIEERNKIMQELAKDVLLLSKEKNDSNEIAITCDLGAENPLGSFGVSLGTEHEVDILADTFSNHIIVSKASVAVVVSNQGTVHYLKRDREYDYKRAFQLFRECIEGLENDSPAMEMYMASLTFLAKCSEVGLFYR